MIVGRRKDTYVKRIKVLLLLFSLLTNGLSYVIMVDDKLLISERKCVLDLRYNDGTQSKKYRPNI